MGFIDSHAHLGDPRFHADRAVVLERACHAGVERILSIAEATQPEDCGATLQLTEQSGIVWAAAGIHPHEARHATDTVYEELETVLRSPRVLAWGEIGLDYHSDYSPRAIQQQVFREQLQRARALKVPVVIHCRDAWSDCVKILSEEWASSGLGGILHCFSGTEETARRALEWGFLISFAGNVTFPRAGELRAASRLVPLESLLIETDCPYLAPQAMRGKRNEPAYVVEVAAELARLRGRTREEIGERTKGNFLRFFPRARS